MNLVPAEPTLSHSQRSQRLTISDSRLSAADTDLLFRLALWVIVYSLVAIAVVRPVTDPDLWWHLRAGQLMVEQGSVLKVDQLSAFGAGKPWCAYSWLFEVFIIRVYEQFGLIGIFAYRLTAALAIAASVHHLVARREPHYLKATALVGAFILAISPSISERPLMLSILFSLWTIDAVLSLREGRHTRWIWLLPLAYIVWANCHIQFVYGLFLMGLACIAPVIDRLLCRSADGHFAATFGMRAWWQLVLLTCLCTAATLVTPYHIGAYKVVFEYGAHRIPFLVVGELKAMEFRRIEDWIALAMFGLAAVALGRRQSISTFEALLLVSTAVFAFRARRDVWFMGLAVIAIVTRSPKQLTSLTDNFALNWRRRAVLASVLVIVFGVIWLTRGLSRNALDEAVVANFPVKAAAEIERLQLKGPIYNTFDWGGYLAWRLPQLPPVIDGRTNLHGDERIGRFELTWNANPCWNQDPELIAANTVIAPAQIPLVSALKLDTSFDLIYSDDVAAVFARRSNQNTTGSAHP